MNQVYLQSSETRCRRSSCRPSYVSTRREIIIRHPALDADMVWSCIFYPSAPRVSLNYILSDPVLDLTEVSHQTYSKQDRNCMYSQLCVWGEEGRGMDGGKSKEQPTVGKNRVHLSPSPPSIKSWHAM